MDLFRFGNLKHRTKKTSNMKKILLLATLIICSVALYSQTVDKLESKNEYKNLWEEVKNYQETNSPQSANQVISKILEKATIDKNFEQILKAYIYRSKVDIKIDSDKNETLIFDQLTNLLSETTNIQDRAILNSLLGALYANYYESYRWFMKDKMELIDYVPSDMKEWTDNIFRDKIAEHFIQSVQDKVVLEKIPTKNYPVIIELGKNSEQTYPSLYDFLMNQAINVLVSSDIYTTNMQLKALNQSNITIADLSKPTDTFIELNFDNSKETLIYQLFQKHLKSLKERNLNEGIVFTELERNSYSSKIFDTYKNKYALNFLLSLEKLNKNNLYNVEIIDAIINKLGFYLIIYQQDELVSETKKEIYDWLNLGINQYPKYYRINILKDKLDEMQASKIKITSASTFYPDDNSKTFTLDYCNINEATVYITNSKDDTIYKQKLNLITKAPYILEDTLINIDINKVGNYKLTIEFDDKKEGTKKLSVDFNISKIASFSRYISDNNYEFYVVDRKNSSPIKNAVITIYAYIWDDNNKKKYTKVGKAITGSDGLATCEIYKENGNQHIYTVKSEGDDLTNYTSLYSGYWRPSINSNNQDEESVSIFTDRTIYRPGQTVYFKAIATLSSKNGDNKLITNKQFEVKLYNVNNQEVSKQTLTTNEFGSIAGEFVIPQSGLNGSYRIQINKSSEYFSVEEYKRPTFEVTFDKVDKTYTFGDSVTITGKVANFSGIKVQGTSVDYSVTKTPFFRWWSGANSQEQIDEGAVTTNADGTFTITFKVPLNEQSAGWFNRSLFNFEIKASVTDQNGETQTGNYNLAIGDMSMLLSTDIGTIYNKESGEDITISARNLNGKEIDTNGTYTIYSVLPNDSINKELKAGTFTTGVNAELASILKSLPSAKYLIWLKAKDEQNREVKDEKYVTLFSYTDKKPPINTNEWFVEKNIEFNESSDAEIIIGLTSKNITILYDLIKDNQVISRKQFKLNDENKTLLIPYKKEYGEGISALFTYVVDGKAYQKQVSLLKKEKAKDLTLKWEVFRDKIRPGDKEDWKILVTENNGKPAFAELLASMYDASLDKLRSPRIWSFNAKQGFNNYVSTFNTDYSFNTINNSLTLDISKYKIPNLEWDKFDWFEGQPFTYGVIFARNNLWETSDIYTGSSESVMIRGISSLAGAPESTSLKQSQMAPMDESSRENSENGINIRSNFDETAFFYPQLNTNAEGEVSISFTVPGSNTSWKFRALAYDKSLNTGKLESLIVSQKQLMVTPNIPRFMRENDRMSISTKVSNLSDSAINGKVRLEFFDPVTDEIKDIIIANQSQNFSLDKDASSAVSWTFTVPQNIDMLGCRIVANSETFSDGEQHLIAVLPNRMLVTESMSMQVNADKSKDFVFDKLQNNTSKTLSNYRLTLEYTDNPTWYAVQALPTLSNPQNENSVAWFASYYTNTLGASIAKQYPKVSDVIKAWKKQGGNQETFISNLQKNAELKNILLEETPWVLDAQNETEQMNRLALLFDLNNVTNQTAAAISKLSSLQNEDGGWSWYKGMYSNRSVTQYLLYGFTQLTNLGVVEYSSDIKIMQIRAIQYIDRKIRAEYEALQTNNKDWKNSNYLSTNQLEYLYVRSAYRDIPIDSTTRQAERFYTSIAENNWTKLNLYQQSLLATLAFRNGNKELSSLIMRSIREYSTQNETMGMYWANNRSSVFMSLSAVSVHTFIMSAFEETKTATKAEMDMMKLWLLKQKQTQRWESTHATTDAIYAILSTGSDWLSTSGQSQITIAGNTIEPENKELGTGYFKETWNANQITKEMAHVSINNANKAPVWAALYWQYYEDLNNVSSQKGELNVDKKLFIDRNGKLFEVSESNSIKVGDKVTIRLTVRVDRDMEYVQLKDMRAACFEPIETLSGMKWQNKTYYYQSTLDASTNFFFEHLAKGTYVLDYSVYATREGEYSNGITSIQCMYAPQFVSHTDGMMIKVK